MGNLNLLISQNDQVIVLQSTNEISSDLPYDNFFSCFKDIGNLKCNIIFMIHYVFSTLTNYIQTFKIYLILVSFNYHVILLFICF